MVKHQANQSVPGRIGSLVKFQHAHCSLVLVRQDDEELEELREAPRDAASSFGTVLNASDISTSAEDLLKRRDTAIVACAVEILVSAVALRGACRI